MVDFSVTTFMVSTVGSQPPNLQTDSGSVSRGPALERFAALDYSMINGEMRLVGR